MTAPLRVRGGFLEALSRRASFTRRHRGPFAAPVEGTARDGSDAPAGYHAGDRIVFAWHQRDDTIGYAAFDTAGVLIGHAGSFPGGRWPRVAAHERGTAIASLTPGGLAVRVSGGDGWGEPVTLSGAGGAIAFAPDGTLTVVNGFGVWRLDGGSFTPLRRGAFVEPALAFDAGNQLHVAFQRGNEIWCNEERIGEGRHPSIVAAADGVHVAWISDNTIHLRHRRGTAPWSEETTIRARAPWAVALALEAAHVRLTYLGRAPFGPDALWLVRLPDALPILMPSVAGNVAAAWLMHKFELRAPRSSYRPHDLAVAFNAEPVQSFERDVAEGRYLFRLDPSSVRTSPARALANDVTVKSRHTNGGHYMINNDFDLIVQTEWSERWGFAASEAELLAERPVNVNEDRPDLVLLANMVRLPMTAPPPGPMPIEVLVMNLGEAPSGPAEVVLTAGERSLARVPVRKLDPREDEHVTVPFDYDGEIKQIDLRLDGAAADFSPASNSLSLHLWTRPGEPVIYDTSAAQPAADLLAGDAATDFTLPLVTEGDVFRLADGVGDVILVNWWRTSCPWSQRETPKLAALYERYRHRGFQILGVSDDTADTVGSIEQYRTTRGVTWPIALNDQAEFVRDVVPSGQGDTPANYLITRSGRLIRLGLDRSDADWDRVEDAVRRALDEPPPQRASITRAKWPPAPALAGAGLDGGRIDLASLAGTPVIVNFFDASTCDWAGGVLADIQQRYGSRGLGVVGVNLFDDDAAARACVKRHRMMFPIVRGTRDMTRDWGLGSKAWGTFFVLPNGRIFKSVLTSINRGIEADVFRRYAEYLVRMK